MSFSRYFSDEDEAVQLSFSAQLYSVGKPKQAVGCAVAVYLNDSDEPFMTDTIWGTQSPNFQKKMSIIPKLNKPQILNIALLEMTPTMKPVNEYNRFGEAKIPLGKILVSNGVVVTLSGAAAEVSIAVSQELKGRGVISMIVAFYNMPKQHWLNKNYPELHVCKKDPASGQWIAVYTSEVIKRQDAGQWDPISIPCRSVCGDDYTQHIRLIVYNRENDSSYKIGWCEDSVENICKMRNKIMVLKPSNKNTARAGNLIIRSAYLFERLTFFGQIRNGLRFNFACAIDFSATNRPPRDPKSLHYTSFGQLNAYQATIASIGATIESYSDGRPFHAWGFGAKYNRVLSHCFPLMINGNKDLNGLKDLQNAYWSIFENIVFDRPISIVPSTKQAIAQVKGSKNPADYLVFVIMIDGIPSDLDAFINLLYDNQMEPISVIIVGIGDSDFSLLEEKFTPGNLKNSDNQIFERDVAVFLRFSNFGMNALDMLMSTALFSVPDQAVHWVDVNVNFI